MLRKGFLASCKPKAPKPQLQVTVAGRLGTVRFAGSTKFAAGVGRPATGMHENGRWEVMVSGLGFRV